MSEMYADINLENRKIIVDLEPKNPTVTIVVFSDGGMNAESVCLSKSDVYKLAFAILEQFVNNNQDREDTDSRCQDDEPKDEVCSYCGSTFPSELYCLNQSCPQYADESEVGDRDD